MSPTLPLRHISIRVPWHDDGWRGTVCRRPRENLACLVLTHVRESKDDEKEERKAGRTWTDLAQADLPPCMAERAGFMAPFDFSRSIEHPYRAISRAHEHLAPTTFRYPAYSAACIPFRWMHNKQAPDIARQYALPWSDDLERRAEELMGYSTDWVQVLENQKALLDAFFSAIQPRRSLCFFYAKRSPLSEDPRRVLIGAGRVAHVGPAVEYEQTRPGPLRSMLWERAIQHTIRPDFQDGFLLPYQQILDLADRDPNMDPSEYVAHAPEDRWLEFSYTSEHVSHDAAITSLLECQKALVKAAGLVPGDWDMPLRWIDARLGELWKMRGPYPGLGAALTAFGVDHGHLVAYDIASALQENEDPWPSVDAAFENPKLLGRGLDRRIIPSLSQAWRMLPPERRSLLKLIARFDLTGEQATRFYVAAERDRVGIDVTDAELLANPYLLYELDRTFSDPISVTTIDRGAFPDPIVREKHPLEAPSAVDAIDPRRVRSLVISVLERAAADGDTLQPRTTVIQTIRGLALNPACPITEDTIPLAEMAFGDRVTQVSLANGKPAYQLARLKEMGNLIRREVERRLAGTPISVSANWGALLNEKLGGPAPEQDEVEKRARQEKVAALEVLARSRVSVLIGPAGTGKTTLLSVLCGVPEIWQRGVRLLAPTGKSRVQLEMSVGGGNVLRAETIAQFLLRIGRYDGQTGIYRLSGQASAQDARTVVVDEASMLTEEMLGALLDGMKGVERLILVGDPRQLPPIGSGRPFMDILARLAPEKVDGIFPRIGPNYAELIVRRRQREDGITPGADERGLDDLLLAEWFSGQAPDPGADEIWDRIAANRDLQRIKLVRWRNNDDLRDRLLEVLVAELGLSSREDARTFEISLGGEVYESFVYFKRGKTTGKVESWQILSPVRGQAHGVIDLNRLIQRQFRKATRDWARSPSRRIPKPFGSEEILYGDKVINTRNHRKTAVWPKEGALEYVANGEIGLVVGQFKYQNSNFRGTPWKLEVEFSSQPGYAYDYTTAGFSDEGDAPLELAYGITVHRAQGSEFGTTILVLPEVCRPLSRELLYTALTRQRDRIVILHQGDLTKLREYAKPSASETARRLTNLFRPPSPVDVVDRFLEGNLINRTRRGELVRSKSEVIIADLLYSKGIDYAYEQRLVNPRDGSFRYPDFTIDDPATGRRVYWEHLGMLAEAGYRARWQRKLTWYRELDILPCEEGGGKGGLLLCTRDDEEGGISSAELERIVDEVLMA